MIAVCLDDLFCGRECSIQLVDVLLLSFHLNPQLFNHGSVFRSHLCLMSLLCLLLIVVDLFETEAARPLALLRFWRLGQLPLLAFSIAPAACSFDYLTVLDFCSNPSCPFFEALLVL